MKTIIATLTFIISFAAFAQTTPEISKEQYDSYAKKAKEKTMIYDTLAFLTKKQNVDVNSIIYKTLIETHFLNQKSDSLQQELLILTRKISQIENQSNKQIREMMTPEQMEGFIKAVKLERKEKQLEDREERQVIRESNRKDMQKPGSKNQNLLNETRKKE